MHKGTLLMVLLGVLFMFLAAGNSRIASAQSTLASVSSTHDSPDKLAAVNKETKSTGATNESETQELRNQIRELQQRLDKLEAKQRATEATSSYLNSTSSGGPASVAQNPTGQENPAKPTQTETANKEKDKGFVDFFRDVELSGFIDGYYGYNFNKPFNR